MSLPALRLARSLAHYVESSRNMYVVCVGWCIIFVSGTITWYHHDMNRRERIENG